MKSGLLMGGKTLWVVSTSALLLGVPWALAYSEEQMIVEQERAEMMNQRAQNEVSSIEHEWCRGCVGMEADSGIVSCSRSAGPAAGREACALVLCAVDGTYWVCVLGTDSWLVLL